jgi:hypothetical protein
MGDLDDRALAVAVDQEVCVAVDEDRPPHLIGPVVVVGDAPQAGLDAADHDRDVAEGLAGALAVHHHRAIGTQPAGAIGGVGVIGAQLPVAGVAVDHRVHVPGGDAEEQAGPPQGGEGRRRPPIGLGDDAMPKLGWST